ncbi:MAG: TetR family transcriptional regulator [Dehalococcoidia bacterium]
MSTQVGLRGHRMQNEERAEGRRRDILLAAARVFARDGYVDATLDDVATQMGVTKGVIYYYFRSKEEIFTEIRATAIREAIERIEAIVARGEAPEATLRATVRDLVGHIFDDLDRFANVLNSGRRLSDESREMVRMLQRRYEGLIRAIIESGIRAAIFVDHDPKLMTFTLLRAVLGVTAWYSPEGRLSPEVIADQVTDQVVRGILRNPPPPTQPRHGRRRGRKDDASTATG